MHIYYIIYIFYFITVFILFVLLYLPFLENEDFHFCDTLYVEINTMHGDRFASLFSPKEQKITKLQRSLCIHYIYDATRCHSSASFEIVRSCLFPH